MLSFKENVGGFKVQNIPEYATKKRYWVVKVVDHEIWFHAASDDQSDAEKLSDESGQPETFIVDRAQMFTPGEVSRISAVLQYGVFRILDGRTLEEEKAVMHDISAVLPPYLAEKIGAKGLGKSLAAIKKKTNEFDMSSVDENMNLIEVLGDSGCWIYFNPDGGNEDKEGNPLGQFVEIEFCISEITDAIELGKLTPDGKEAIFQYVSEYGKTHFYDYGDPETEPIKREFLDTLNGEVSQAVMLGNEEAEKYIFEKVKAT